jgi:hypothetical protein
MKRKEKNKFDREAKKCNAPFPLNQIKRCFFIYIIFFKVLPDQNKEIK